MSNDNVEEPYEERIYRSGYGRGWEEGYNAGYVAGEKETAKDAAAELRDMQAERDQAQWGPDDVAFR